MATIIQQIQIAQGADKRFNRVMFDAHILVTPPLHPIEPVLLHVEGVVLSELVKTRPIVEVAHLILDGIARAIAPYPGESSQTESATPGA